MPLYSKQSIDKAVCAEHPAVGIRCFSDAVGVEEDLVAGLKREFVFGVDGIDHAPVQLFYFSSVFMERPGNEASGALNME